MLNKLKSLFNKDEKGFTLVEILVVIIVIGILFTVLISRMDVAGDQARTKGVQTDFRGFTTAAESMMRANAGQNVSEVTLNEFADPAMQVSGTKSQEKDPWGVEYDVNFVKKEDNGVYSMVSFTSTGKGSEPDDEYTTATYYFEGVVESCTTDTMGSNTINLQTLNLATGQVCGGAVDSKNE